MNKKSKIKNNSKGAIVLLVLVFAGVMILIFSGTAGFIFTQNRLQIKKIEKELAIQIAEAGLNYYKWFLSHYPNDLRDGTGAAGPYEHEYYDPEGGAVGKFSLNINGNTQCNSVTSIDIASTGWTYNEPNIKRVVKAKYSRPSVAEFAYIIDDNVWAGADREIKGKYHSNGGIRMDGENDSLVTSALTTWNCTPSFGCVSPYEVRNGVFGGGGGSEFWQFPAEQINFTSIAVDLAQMKSAAQTYGVYLPPPSGIGYPSGLGYHIIFKNNGTFDIYVITRLNRVWSYSSDQGWHWSYEVINRESFYQNRAVPSGCGLIFVEDDLWVEGEVKGKTTIASADLITPNVDTNVILDGNITYTALDGTDGLLVLGENNISIPLYSPNVMELRGIYMAQKGRFGRDHYTSTYSPWYDRQKMEIHGSIVSKKRVGTQWIYDNGGFASGYRVREDTYDRKLMINPPPLTPFSDDEYMFVKWEEVN